MFSSNQTWRARLFSVLSLKASTEVHLKKEQEVALRIFSRERMCWPCCLRLWGKPCVSSFCRGEIVGLYRTKFTKWLCPCSLFPKASFPDNCPDRTRQGTGDPGDFMETAGANLGTNEATAAIKIARIELYFIQAIMIAMMSLQTCEHQLRSRLCTISLHDFTA